jgi:hypothetical protein
LLRKCGEAWWADQLDESKGLIESRDFRGVELVFNSYGGMGSFNDLVIHPMNGHAIGYSDLETIDNELRRLQTHIYELVRGLRHFEAS